MASEIDQLVRDIKATGSFDVRSNGTHHKVVNEAGAQVYVLPKSPSDHRWRENAIHGLIRAGVFESDPRRGNGKKINRGHSRLSDPDVQAAKVAAVRARAAHYAEITDAIRDRLNPLVTKVGGWGIRKGQVTAAELGLVAKHWGRDRPDVFKSDSAARASAQGNMKQRGACSPQACTFWDAFVTAWESAEEPRRWYFDLVREMKGLEPTKVIVGGQEQTRNTEYKKTRSGRVRTYMMEPEEEAEPEEVKVELDPGIGKLALKAVFLMTVGRKNVDQEDVLEVGEQILALEARARDFTSE